MLQLAPSCKFHALKNAALLVGFALTLITTPAAATVYVTGSVSADNQTLGYKKSDSKSGSASIELGLGESVRIGFTHEQSVQTVKGYDVETDENDVDNYTPVDDYTRLAANSIDTTLVLYNGEVFAPFIKGGLIIKSYTLRTINKKSISPEDQGLADTEFEYTTTKSTLPTWQAGAGLGIRLNRQFTLRLAYMFSPGVEIAPGQDAKDAKKVLDRKGTIGLSYQIQ